MASRYRKNVSLVGKQRVEPGSVVFKQYQNQREGSLSYLVGDPDKNVAVVVDPDFEVEPYLKDADECDLAIKNIFLTHEPDEECSGHNFIKKRTGASIHTGLRANQGKEHLPVGNGDMFEFDHFGVEIVETPGQCIEGISLLLYHVGKDRNVPNAIFTGRTLLIGEIDRPRLNTRTETAKSELIGMLYTTIHEIFLKLPEETVVFPGGMNDKDQPISSEELIASTIGKERVTNRFFKPMSQVEFGEFIESVISSIEDRRETS